MIGKAKQIDYLHGCFKDIAQFENIYDEMRIKFHKHQGLQKQCIHEQVKGYQAFQSKERTMAHVMLSGTDGVEDTDAEHQEMNIMEDASLGTD